MKGLNKDGLIRRLKQEKPFLAREFGVVSLALFGSAARNAAGPASDIDLLVQFDGPATSRRYFGVQFHLEDVLNQPIDLVTDKALRPELRPFIEQECVNV
ncbi:MAG: nucleotidyltransferase family protein [Wenzhouxiangella sp.]